MPDQPKKFYLTTPIYYVNARPHIGHAYSTIVADVLARRHRLLGEDVYFLTGTDEHGQKIERSAAAAGIPTQQYADQVSKTFSDLWARMGITHNQFIRTTDPKHIQGVQKLFADLFAKGQIYLSSYTGQYSVGEEMFVEGPPGTIGPDGKPTETVTEENFFFRLSDYQLPLLNLIESNELPITPDSSRNEVLAFLRGNTTALTSPPHESVILSEGAGLHPAPQPKDLHGAEPTPSAQTTSTSNLAHTAAGTPYVPGALRDLSVSRSSFTWGIPVPEPAASETKQKHVIYVWLDALANYMTALGYGSPDDALWQKFWPADIHLVGKEITRFHCVYWPAFLLAAGLPLPKQVTANGWLLFDNSKMSKSKGNVVRTETILDAFGTLCPPPPAGPAPSHPNSVIPTEARQSGDTHVFPSPLQQSVILSEGAGHHPAPQSKDLHDTGPATTAETISTTTPTEPTAADRDLFAADILRYYLLREIPFGQDGSFSFESLITRYNADLANGYGNLVSRTLSMIEKYCSGAAPIPDTVSLADLYDRSLITGHIVYQLGIRSQLEDLTAVLEDRPLTQDALGTARVPIAELAADLLQNAQFDLALERISRFISGVDAHITSNAPWKLAKLADRKDQLEGVLYVAAESIRIITALLYPILPYATARVWAQLGLGDIEAAAREGKLTNLQWGGLKPGTKLGPLSPIFPRADKGLAQIMIDNEEKLTSQNSPLKTESTTSERPEAPLKSASTTTPAAPTPTDPTSPAAPPRSGAPDTSTLPVAGSTATTTNNGPTPSHTEAQPSGIFANQPATPNLEPTTPTITIDDFIKIELRVAQIVLAERIPKADKLLRLEVDLGELGKRQILSGIAEWYTPEDLTGRKIVVITNLAPRKMRGLDSHGMLLAASVEGGKPVLATFGEDIPNGTRLK